MRAREHRTARFTDAVTSREGARVTTLELFFDLVFVFAFHQVSAIMTDGGTAAVPRGLVILALVWWSWAPYAWLANQARADGGIVRVGVVVATAVMFLVALSIPEAFDDLPGGLSGPLVFVVCYLLVRVVHAVVYVVAAGEDAALRREVLVSVPVALAPAAVLLVVGAVAGEPAQAWLWGAAVLVDLVIVYATSRRGARWRLRSASHFAERHALVVILALGESVIAIGAVAGGVPVDARILGGALVSVGLALALWWAYFHRLAGRAEDAVAGRADEARAALAVDVYTYLHLVLVAGIVVAAVGVEEAMVRVGSGEAAGWFAAWTLGGGVATYLAGITLIGRRVSGRWDVVPGAGSVATLAVAPLLAVVPAPAAPGILLVVVLATVGAGGRRGRGGAPADVTSSSRAR